MITVTLLLVGAAVGLVFSAFFSGVETGAYCVNRVRLRVRADQQADPSARRLAQVMDEPEPAVITTLIGTNIADYFTTACITAAFVALAVRDAELYTTLTATPLVLVFGSLLPKEWVRRDDRVLYRLSLPIYGCVAATRAIGVVWLLNSVARWVMRQIDPSRVDLPQLLPRARTVELLREGAARGGLSVVQREIMERVLRVSAVSVSSVMVPRDRAAMLPVDVPRETFMRVARMAHFSRLPLHQDQGRRVVGVVNVIDVLTDAEARPIRDYMQPAFSAAATLTVPEALVRMQEARQAMAIVTDRNGVCLGLFTMKDLVEEIVGELSAW